MRNRSVKQLLNALKEKDAKNRIETSVDWDGGIASFIYAIGVSTRMVSPFNKKRRKCSGLS
jgi:predicted Mrr-cat superfamily restriction endonuclease